MTLVLDIAQIRRMTAEPTQAPYTDAVISGYLTTVSGDMNAVAGEIWAEKASNLVSTMYDFSADNTSYNLSQVVANAVAQAKYFNSKRLPRTSLWVKDPVELDTDWPYDEDWYDFEYQVI